MRAALSFSAIGAAELAQRGDGVVLVGDDPAGGDVDAAPRAGAALASCSASHSPRPRRPARRARAGGDLAQPRRVPRAGQRSAAAQRSPVRRPAAAGTPAWANPRRRASSSSSGSVEETSVGTGLPRRRRSSPRGPRARTPPRRRSARAAGRRRRAPGRSPGPRRASAPARRARRGRPRSSRCSRAGWRRWPRAGAARAAARGRRRRRRQLQPEPLASSAPWRRVAARAGHDREPAAVAAGAVAARRASWPARAARARRRPRPRPPPRPGVRNTRWSPASAALWAAAARAPAAERPTLSTTTARPPRRTRPARRTAAARRRPRGTARPRPGRLRPPGTRGSRRRERTAWLPLATTV